MSRSMLALACVVAVLALPAPLRGGDPLTVTCAAEPRDGVHDVTLQPVWTIPAETGDYLFGRLVDARVDRDGKLCLVDYQLKNLKVLAPDGTWLRTIGREGEGPGECLDARQVFLRADGAYGLLQAVPGAIVWLNPDGTPAGRLRVGGDPTESAAFTAVGWAVQTGEGIYAWTIQALEREGGQRMRTQVVRLAPDGALGAPLYEPPEAGDDAVGADGVLNEGLAYDIWARRWCPTAAGGIWVAPERNRYVLQYWLAGELRLVVERPGYLQIERTEAVRRQVRAGLSHKGWSGDRLRVGAAAPVVEAVSAFDDGDLWVVLDRGGHGPPAEPAIVCDIFSPEGTWLRQVRCHAGHPLDRWRLLDRTHVIELGREAGTVTLFEIPAAS